MEVLVRATACSLSSKMLLGGMAENVFKRVVAWGDGWIPNRVTPEDVREGRMKLDELARDAGRDPASIQIIVSGQPPDSDLIKQYEDAGAVRVVVRLAAMDEDQTMEGLDRIAEAVLA